MKLFIDTWGFKAFLDAKESKNKSVVKIFSGLISKNKQIYTSNYILSETITLLAIRCDFNIVKKFIESTNKLIENNLLVVLWINSEEHNTAINLRLKFKDKLDISFVDLTSMVLMNKYKITKILTEDRHFEHVGMKFKLQP